MPTLRRMLKTIIQKTPLARFSRELRHKARVDRYTCILNINLDLTVDQSRALVVYVPTIFHTTQSAKRIVHTNALESAQMVRELVRRNFCVDVFDCNKSAQELKDLLSGKDYDLIIGLGAAFEAACDMFPQAKTVIYITENHPDLSLKNELERIERYRAVYGRPAKLERTNTYFTKDCLSKHDFGIILGDLSSFDTEPIRKYSLCPTGFGNPQYIPFVEDLESAKRSFIWMGTNAPIHKGLDVLFEAFACRPELVLNVVGMTNKQLDEYGLSHSKNIIVHGFMNIASPDFMRLANTSCFMILPSCSEAMSTSVLTGMRHGLIPMVLSGVGMDGIPSALRITLEGYLPKELGRNLEEASNAELSWLGRMREEIYEYANKQYSIDRYAREFGSILDNVVDVKIYHEAIGTD